MSHGPANGASAHREGCGCTRCVGITSDTARELGARGGLEVRHGARSERFLAPIVSNVQEDLLVRMGLRHSELTWAGRELLDMYARSKAKLIAIDDWLEREPMIREDGSYPAVMGLYLNALRVSTRTLDALRGVVAELAREDRDIASALAALDAEESRR